METDFEILGHVIADHYRAVVKLREQNTQLAAENEQLRQALAAVSGHQDSETRSSTPEPSGDATSAQPSPQGTAP